MFDYLKSCPRRLWASIRRNLLPSSASSAKLVETLSWVYGPAIASVLAAVLFALPDPVHEIYLILASDTVNLLSGTFDPFGDLRFWELFVRTVLSVVCVYLMVGAIWHATRYAVINSPRGHEVYNAPPNFKGSQTIDKDLSWSPHVLATLPVLGLLIGVVTTSLSEEATVWVRLVLIAYAIVLVVLACQGLTRSTFRKGTGLSILYEAGKVPYAWIAFYGLATYCIQSAVFLSFLWYALLAVGVFGAFQYVMVRSAEKGLREGKSITLPILYFLAVSFALALSARVRPEDVTFWEAYRAAFEGKMALIIAGYIVVVMFALLVDIAPSELTAANRKPRTGKTKVLARWYFGFTCFAVVITIIYPGIWVFVGPIALGCMFFGAIAFHTSFLSVISARYVNGIPLNVVWVAVAVGMFNFDLTGQHRVEPVATAQGFDDYRAAATEWLAKREGDDGPIYLIAAQGGGLYAAYHAAFDLAARSDADQDFANRVFAISSVSGGSVGAATYWAIRRCSLSTDCAEGHDPDEMYQTATQNILERDFLTPVAGGMLYPDLFQAFVPWLQSLTGFERGQALTKGVGQAIAGTLDAEQRAAFDGSVVGTSDGSDPLLLINVTRLHDGQHIVFAPITPKTRLAGEDGTQDVSLADAVIASARFPLVTPGARMYFDGDDLGASQMIDGGFFDNSGLEGLAPALDALSKVLDKKGIDREVIVIAYTLDVPEADARGTAGLVMTPITGLENVRAARNVTTAQAFQQKFGEHMTYHECALNTAQHQLTLSWLLAETTFEAMRGQICETVQAATPTNPCPILETTVEEDDTDAEQMDDADVGAAGISGDGTDRSCGRGSDPDR